MHRPTYSTYCKQRGCELDADVLDSGVSIGCGDWIGASPTVTGSILCAPHSPRGF